MRPPRHRPADPGRCRRSEHGLFRSCCLGLVVLIVLVVAAAVLTFRITSSPDLGAAPGGSNDGESTGTIAATLLPKLVAQLQMPKHAALVLSEHDLSVIAREQNPDPGRFRSPEVRSRDGFLVVDAQTSFGPFQVVSTARLMLTLGNHGHLDAKVVEVDLGAQSIPEWLRSFVDPRGAAAISIDPFVSLLQDPKLQPIRDLLECGAVVPQGFEFSFHPPGLPADPGRCGTVA